VATTKAATGLARLEDTGPWAHPTTGLMPREGHSGPVGETDSAAAILELGRAQGPRQTKPHDQLRRAHSTRRWAQRL
jgi:hypothetical protein